MTPPLGLDLRVPRFGRSRPVDPAPREERAPPVPAPLASAIQRARLVEAGSPVDVGRLRTGLARTAALATVGAGKRVLDLLAHLPDGGGAVGLTLGRQGQVFWHLPRPGDLAEVRVPLPLPSLRDVLPFALGRDRAGRVVRLFRSTVQDAAVDLLRNVERAGKPAPGLKFFGGRASMQPVPPDPGQGGARVLLFVHGIFDSLEGLGFWGLRWDGPTMRELHRRYGGRVMGFDHHTVSDTPLDSARKLVEALPAGVHLDVVCHSRGALVVRAALRHPALRALKEINVRKLVLVGGANQGSALAEPGNWSRLFSVYSTAARRLLASVPPGTPQAEAAERAADAVFDLVVRSVAVAAREAGGLPGIAELAPGSTEIRAVEAGKPSRVGEVYAMRANFARSRSPVFAGLDYGADGLFAGEPNDLVVPFGGAGVFDGRVPERNTFGIPFGSEAAGQGEHHHLNYFDDADARSRLLEWLM